MGCGNSTPPAPDNVKREPNIPSPPSNTDTRNTEPAALVQPKSGTKHLDETPLDTEKRRRLSRAVMGANGVAAQVKEAIQKNDMAKLKGSLGDDNVYKDTPCIRLSGEAVLTPAAYAAEQGQTGCLGALIELRCDLTVKDSQGHDALYWAARNGHPDCIKILLEYGVALQASKNGQHALHAAVLAPTDGDASESRRRRSLQVLQQLCAHKACFPSGDLTSKAEKEGFTALDYAVKNGFKEEAECLSTAGIPWQEDLTPLGANHKDWSFLSSSAGDTGDCTAAEFMRNIAAGSAAAVEVAIDAHPEYLDNGALTVGHTQMSALSYAAEQGQAAMIQTLLDKGAAIQAVDSVGRDALYWACSGYQAEALKVLLSNGAKLGASDEKGNTALHVAVLAKTMDACASDTSTAIVQQLCTHASSTPEALNQRGTPLLPGSEGPTALDLAVVYSMKARATVLKEQGNVEWNPMVAPIDPRLKDEWSFLF